MQLPDPPLLQHLLLEEPIPAVGALAGAGLALLWLGRRRGQRRVTLAGLLVLLVGAGLWALADRVTTTRELLLQQTRSLVHATVPLDVPVVRRFFDQDAALVGPQGQTWLNLHETMDDLQRASIRFRFQAHQIRQLQAQALEGGQGYSYLELRTTLGTDFGDRAVPTTWLLTWARGEDGQWRIVNVQWLTLGEEPPKFGAWR